MRPADVPSCMMRTALVDLLAYVRRVVRAIQRYRHTKHAKMTLGSYGEPLYVNGRSSFTRRTCVGKNTHFNGLTVAGLGSVTIGDNFHSGPDCLLITSIHNYDHGSALPYDHTHIMKDIVIEDNVWLGSRVTIVGGIVLGEGCIVQAGAVVVSDVPKCAIAGGNPATVFKTRDVDHYERLKAEGKFA
jgi:chloramphenicol O-acetyltransferase type B